jgi:hypothetical protein
MGLGDLNLLPEDLEKNDERVIKYENAIVTEGASRQMKKEN